MNAHTLGRPLGTLLAALLFAPVVLGQIPPPSPHGGAPPLPRFRPDRRPQDDPARWERWWDYNREDFLVARGVLAPDVVGDAYTGTLAPPTALEIRAKVIPVLVALLKEGDHAVRANAALSLGKVGDWRELKILTAAADDRERNVAEAAIAALGVLGEPAAEPTLRAVMSETTRSARERGMAAIALGLSGGDVARDALFDKLGTTVDAEGRGRVPIVESARLLGAGLWSASDLKDRQNDRSALVAAVMVRTLTPPDLKDRVILGVGTAALSKPRDPGSIQFILHGLTDSRSVVRTGCGIAAGRVIKADDRRSVQALIAAIDTEADPTAKRMMLISLGRIGGPDARKRLVEELESNLRQERAFAGLALGVAGASDLAPRIRDEFLEASDDTLKGAMAIALGLMRDPEALKLVAAVAKSKGNPELTRHLMWFFALDRGRGASTAVRRALEESRIPEVHDAGCIALGLIGDLDAQNFLIRQLTSSAPPRLRAAAAIGLGRMGDARAIDPLIAMATSDETQIVRAGAVAGLGILCLGEPWLPLARVTIDANFEVAHEPIERYRDLP